MFQYQKTHNSSTEFDRGGKTITALADDYTGNWPKSGTVKIAINAKKSIYDIRKEAGWPAYRGNVTDTFIIKYLKENFSEEIEGDRIREDYKNAKGYIRVPTYKSYLERRKDIGGTALIVYAHPKSSPNKDNPLSFKKNATKKAKILQDSGNYDDVVLAECFTEDEFLAAVNKNYKSGKITRLEVFSHSSDNSIILGDRFEPKTKDEKYKDNNDAKDRRWFSRRDGSHGEKNKEHEVLNIDKNKFSKDCRVILWGCRQAGGDFKKGKYKDVPTSESFAKELANHLRVPVQAFFNTSRTPEYTDKNGKLKRHTPGYMVPEANAKEVMVMPGR